MSASAPTTTNPQIAENLALFSALAQVQDDTPYYAAVGKFVIEYAAAEIAFNELAIKLSGVTVEKALIMFGKMRRADFSNKIRLLMQLENIKAETIEIVEGCINQFDKIALERGKLVHQQVTIEKPVMFQFIGKHFKVKNVLKPKPITSNERSIFTLEHILQMTNDCVIIFLRLWVAKSPYLLEEKTPEQIAFLYSPWLYKPPQPDIPKKPRQKARKVRKRLRASSRA